MAPGLVDGDRLLVAPALTLLVGDVVAARDPRHPARILVKRIAAEGPQGLDLRGDNATFSTDSRHFGPVPRALVLGRVVYRYAPPARSGRWPAKG
jgi:nickel-type superoxide dismutase maturation protease